MYLSSSANLDCRPGTTGTNRITQCNLLPLNSRSSTRVDQFPSISVLFLELSVTNQGACSLQHQSSISSVHISSWINCCCINRTSFSSHLIVQSLTSKFVFTRSSLFLQPFGRDGEAADPGSDGAAVRVVCASECAVCSCTGALHAWLGASACSHCLRSGLFSRDLTRVFSDRWFSCLRSGSQLLRSPCLCSGSHVRQLTAQSGVFTETVL